MISILHRPVPGLMVEQYYGRNSLAAPELAEVFTHSAPVMPFAAKPVPPLGIASFRVTGPAHR